MGKYNMLTIVFIYSVIFIPRISLFTSGHLTDLIFAFLIGLISFSIAYAIESLMYFFLCEKILIRQIVRCLVQTTLGILILTFIIKFLTNMIMVT